MVESIVYANLCESIQIIQALPSVACYSGYSSCMAKKKSDPKPEPKAKQTRSDANPLLFYVDDATKKAFDDYLNSRKDKPAKKTVLLNSLHAYLKAEGFWPPKS